MRGWVAGVVFIYSTKSLFCDKFSLFTESNPVCFLYLGIWWQEGEVGVGGGLQVQDEQVVTICLHVIFHHIVMFHRSIPQLTAGLIVAHAYNSVPLNMEYFFISYYLHQTQHCSADLFFHKGNTKN